MNYLLSHYVRVSKIKHEKNVFATSSKTKLVVLLLYTVVCLLYTVVILYTWTL